MGVYVRIGTYSVSFELDGFKKAVRNGIIITTASRRLSTRRWKSATRRKK
jgi:hypothetical protein